LRNKKFLDEESKVDPKEKLAKKLAYAEMRR
jgi:hypothetical protein